MKTRILLFAMFLMAAFNSNAQSPCNAAFSYTVAPSGVVTFYSSSNTIYSTQTYSWTFGNGTSGYGTQTTCAYNAPGTYTVCLTVHDSSLLNGPCIDTVCNTITIAGTTPCNASFTYAVNTTTANTFDFTSTSTGTNLSYLWFWNDGSPYGTTQRSWKVPVVQNAH